MPRSFSFVAAALAATLFTGCVDSSSQQQPSDNNDNSDSKLEFAHSYGVKLTGHVLTDIQLPPLGCKSLEGVTSNAIVTTTISDCSWDASAGMCTCTVNMTVRSP